MTSVGEVEERGTRGARHVLHTAARAQAAYPVAQVIALAVVFAIGATTLDGFATRRSIYAMLVLAAFLGIAGAGQTLCLLIGGIDLSIAAWIVAGATITVQLVGSRGWPFVAALAVIVLGAVVVGGSTGFVCHRFGVDTLVATLASGSIVAGAVLVWTKGYVDSYPPTWLQRFASPAGKTLGMEFPPLVALWAVAAVVIGAVLGRTVVGRRLYATGSNIRAAELALVRTRLVWMGVYAFSAVLASIAGILLAGFAGAVSNTIGGPYLWQSLTAVIVGGTAFGGRGDYWRTVIGSLLLIELSTVMIGHGYTAQDQQILFGILILVVVAFYGRDRRLGDRV